MSEDPISTSWMAVYAGVEILSENKNSHVDNIDPNFVMGVKFHASDNIISGDIEVGGYYSTSGSSKEWYTDTDSGPILNHYPSPHTESRKFGGMALAVQSPKFQILKNAHESIGGRIGVRYQWQTEMDFKENSWFIDQCKISSIGSHPIY